MKYFYSILVAFSFLIILDSCTISRRTMITRSKERKVRSESKKSYAEKSTKAVTLRDEIIIHATKYAGRRYKYGGKSPVSGFDCSGYVSYVFGQAGVDAPGASHQQAKLGKKKARNNLRPGDLVFFGTKDKVSHVSIVYSNFNNQLKVIHSTSSRGVVIDDVSKSAYWQERYLYGTDLYSIYTDDAYAGASR